MKEMSHHMDIHTVHIQTSRFYSIFSSVIYYYIQNCIIIQNVPYGKNENDLLYVINWGNILTFSCLGDVQPDASSIILENPYLAVKNLSLSVAKEQISHAIRKWQLFLFAVYNFMMGMSSHISIKCMILNSTLLLLLALTWAIKNFLEGPWQFRIVQNKTMPTITIFLIHL